jgi:hypothetical protein
MADVADRLVRRGARLNGNLRRIDIEIRVAEPGKWRKIAGLLEELAEFATGGDSWSLSFAGGATDEVRSRILKASDAFEPTTVALFSGGLDSLCGAAWLASRKDSRPIFVTHSPPGRESVQQLVQDVFRAFGRELPAGACVDYRLELREGSRSGTRSMFQETSRRTRPFFYLALASATAIAYEASTVQMAENGVLALSLPHRADAHGPSIARQAHTFLLAGFQMLLRELVPGVAWVVTNPFINETKGEACLRLGPAAGFAKRSLSCEYLGRQRAAILGWKQRHPRSAKSLGDGPQCGLCVPCIVRRAALRHAGIPDPDGAYFMSGPKVLAKIRKRGTALEFFADQPPPLINMLVPNVLYIERHCRWLVSTDVSEFAIQYLPELRANRQLTGGPPMDVLACHDLARRYAHEILKSLNG